MSENGEKNIVVDVYEKQYTQQAWRENQAEKDIESCNIWFEQDYDITKTGVVVYVLNTNYTLIEKLKNCGFSFMKTLDESNATKQEKFMIQQIKRKIYREENSYEKKYVTMSILESYNKGYDVHNHSKCGGHLISVFGGVHCQGCHVTEDYDYDTVMRYV